MCVLRCFFSWDTSMNLRWQWLHSGNEWPCRNNKKSVSAPFRHRGALEACWEQDFYNNRYVWKAVGQRHFCQLSVGSPEPEVTHSSFLTRKVFVLQKKLNSLWARDVLMCAKQNPTVTPAGKPKTVTWLVLNFKATFAKANGHSIHVRLYPSDLNLLGSK